MEQTDKDKAVLSPTEKVVVFPGTEKLSTFTVGELTELRLTIEKYDDYIKSLIRKKVL